jgi:hypothetical protein
LGPLAPKRQRTLATVLRCTPTARAMAASLLPPPVWPESAGSAASSAFDGRWLWDPSVCCCRAQE